MTQEDIMIYLDNHPGKKFSHIDLKKTFQKTMNTGSVCHALNRIIRREEYCCEIQRIDGYKIAVYYKKEQEEENGRK